MPILAGSKIRYEVATSRRAARARVNGCSGHPSRFSREGDYHAHRPRDWHMGSGQRDPVDLLDAYLLSDQSPSECMMLSDLDGFLTGIAIGPELVMPREMSGVARSWCSMTRPRGVHAGRG